MHRIQPLILGLCLLSQGAIAQTASLGVPVLTSAGRLSLPDVEAAGQRFQIDLQLQADGMFTIVGGQALAQGVSTSPAVYATATGLLTIPRVFALERYYAATLTNIGNFVFSVTGATETTRVDNLMAWQQTPFRSTTPKEARHVKRVAVQPSGRIHAAWYSQDFRAYMGYSDDQGASWRHTELDRTTQINQVIVLQNGTLVAGGTTALGASLLWYSTDNGQTWRNGARGSGGAEGLPNARSAMIWDLAERAGEVIITTSSETNAPSASHQVVYAWNPATDTLRALAALPGMGALAVAVSPDGTLYVSTQDSAEHDDPATAGEGRVYRSTNGGVSWTQTGTLASANRIYALKALSDGSIVAGSGLNGGVYRSTDGHQWAKMTTLPQGSKPFGNPPVMQGYDITRAYQFLELTSGALLVGTGNDTGSIFLSCDRGVSWESTAKTGSNIVVWGLAQGPDGTIWVGNGSLQGDVWKASPPTGVTPQKFFSCG